MAARLKKVEIACPGCGMHFVIAQEIRVRAEPKPEKEPGERLPIGNVIEAYKAGYKAEVGVEPIISKGDSGSAYRKLAQCQKQYGEDGWKLVVGMVEFIMSPQNPQWAWHRKNGIPTLTWVLSDNYWTRTLSIYMKSEE